MLGLVGSASVYFHKAFNDTLCQKLLGKLSSHDIRKVPAQIRNRQKEACKAYALFNKGLLSKGICKPKVLFREVTPPYGLCIPLQKQG